MTKFITIAVIILTILFSCNSEPTKSKNDTSFAATETNILNEALQSNEYKNAWMNVEKLKINVGLAEKGNLDSDSIVNEYNEEIGSTLGDVDKVSEVRIKLKNIDSTYLKMIQLDVAGKIALQNAANAKARINQLKAN